MKFRFEMTSSAQEKRGHYGHPHVVYECEEVSWVETMEHFKAFLAGCGFILPSEISDEADCCGVCCKDEKEE